MVINNHFQNKHNINMWESILAFLDNIWFGFWAFKPAFDPFILLFYFLPLVICSVTWFFQTIGELSRDAQNLKAFNNKETNSYNPEVTIGTILFRAFWSVIPIANLLITIFDRLESFSRWLKGTFDIPIVGKAQRRSTIK